MIETKRLLLREFMEVDYDDLYEFLSQLENDEFEGYPEVEGYICMSRSKEINNTTSVRINSVFSIFAVLSAHFLTICSSSSLGTRQFLSSSNAILIRLPFCEP